MPGSVYEQAVRVTRDYLGPAAERFIRRQVSFHLQKDPERLTLQDIPQLAEWIKVSIAILTEDRHMVEEFSSRIQDIVKSKR